MFNFELLDLPVKYFINCILHCLHKHPISHFSGSLCKCAIFDPGGSKTKLTNRTIRERKFTVVSQLSLPHLLVEGFSTTKQLWIQTTN